MEVKKIYFDMDGVLTDFDKGVKDILGLKPVNQADKTNAQDDEMFEAMRKTDHFYERLEPLPGALIMFNMIYKEYGGDKCEILSGIPKPRRGIVTAKEDKINWIHKFLSKNIVVNIVYREEKKNYCTGPDCILIDDFIKNINEWEALGGTGILHTSVDDTIKQLTNLGIIKTDR